MTLLCLAALGPDDHPYLLYAVILGGIALTAVTRNVIGSVKDWHELKSRNTGGDWATKAELREAHARVDSLIQDFGRMRGEINATLAAAGDKFAASLQPLSEQLGGIQRSLGRVEGLEKIIEEHGKDIDQLQSGTGRNNRPR